MDKRRIFHKIIGIIFIVIGILFYLTPLPGTTFLIAIGLVLLIGEKKTSVFLKKILGKKNFNSLKINKIVNKL